jgi:XTP/dITP diphosphohydrolase
MIPLGFKKILIASNNKGKFFEIESLLKSVNIEAVPAFKFNLLEPEENGKTFAENSILKAQYYGKKTGLIALADDSGLCVEALNGAPGIHSARFAIDDKTGKKNFPLAFEKIFFQLQEIGINLQNSPKAYFVCNLSLFNPQNNFTISFEGRVDGVLTFPAFGDKGFGYDPIFIKNGMTKTFGEIAAQEKDLISHRGMAFKKFVDWFKNNKPCKS